MRAEQFHSLFEREARLRNLSLDNMGRLKLKNPTVTGPGGPWEVINQPYFDSFSVAQGAAFPATTLFQTANKVTAQSNMTLAGQLPGDQRLVVMAIRLHIANNTAPVDVANILQNVSMTLVIRKKPMLECPALYVPSGLGMNISAVAQVGTAPAGSAVVVNTSNGKTDYRAVFALSRPFTIDGGESFYLKLNPDTAFNFSANTANPPGNGTTIYVFLDGELTRSVQ